MKNSPARQILVLSAAWVVVLATASVQAADDPVWPREIHVPEANIVVYQPQLESFAKNTLTARAAVAVTPSGATDPVFGAVWFKCKVETDRDQRLVTLIDMDVPEVKFPDAKPEQIEKLGRILKPELTKQAHPISLDRLLTALELADKEKAAAENLSTKAPKILFVRHPAVLISIDGQPQLRTTDNSKVMRVINTPFLILLEPSSKSYYLRGGDDWFTAGDIKGPWQAAKDPPDSISALVVKDPNASEQDAAAFPKREGMPQIIVATEPSELISCDGEPKYSPIADTSLLYMSNTDSDVFMEISSQKYFVLLSGRWYSAKSMNGPWTYVPADKLPDDFAKIPEGSDKGHVLAHVAGTDQAVEAVQDSCIPQTAKIDRKKATLKVNYDGAPRFKAIEGTEMAYAENTECDVIRIHGKYYCCSEAVWFLAEAPTGPWILCDAVPQVIYTIPPECPVYSVRYVQVYESTPEYVYVGYTPGYVGCYPFCGAVVYGTGFYYHSWYGAYYYPRPATWGFSAHYNSVTGNWGVRAGYAGPNGWVAFGYHDGRFYQGAWVAGGTWGHGWWGHGGFTPTPYVRGGNINNINVNNVNINNNRLAVNNRQNIYNRSTNVNRNIINPAHADRPGWRSGGVPPAQSRLANDVYSDRNGNVYRHNQEGWQQRTGNNWSKADLGNREQPRADRPSQTPRPSNTEYQHSAQQAHPSYSSGGYSSNRHDLDRQSYARDRGASRSNNFQQFSAPRGGGGFRGGGRR